VRLLHSMTKIHATFDDPHLVSRAGLVPVMALAQRAGLADLAGEHVRIARRCGVNAPVKVGCLVAGMTGGADSIDDLDLLRHGAMPALFGGIRAPSTLGSFLRSFTWGNVLQLGKVSRLLLAELARRAPLLPGRHVLAFVDIDSQQKRVYGYSKQGAAFGHAKIAGKSLLVRGLNALAATISTPLGAPVIAATRLRGGNAASARGAASFAAEAVGTARATGCSGILVVRADSAFYSAAFTGAVRRAGAFFSVTVQMNPHVQSAIAAIGEDCWIPIRYPRAIWDDQLRAWVSDAEVAEVPYTAFTSKKGQAITARLIVRRVKDLNPAAARGQDELFPSGATTRYADIGVTRVWGIHLTGVGSAAAAGARLSSMASSPAGGPDSAGGPSPAAAEAAGRAASCWRAGPGNGLGRARRPAPAAGRRPCRGWPSGAG
jgi:hypothetical protein